MQKPGQVDFPGDKRFSVNEAITAAGGLTRFAQKSNIVIIRGGKQIRFNFRAFEKDPRVEVPVLEDGDVVEVPQTIF